MKHGLYHIARAALVYLALSGCGAMDQKPQLSVPTHPATKADAKITAFSKDLSDNCLALKVAIGTLHLVTTGGVQELVEDGKEAFNEFCRQPPSNVDDALRSAIRIMDIIHQIQEARNGISR